MVQLVIAPSEAGKRMLVGVVWLGLHQLILHAVIFCTLLSVVLAHIDKCICLVVVLVASNALDVASGGQDWRGGAGEVVVGGDDVQCGGLLRLEKWAKHLLLWAI